MGDGGDLLLLATVAGALVFSAVVFLAPTTRPTSLAQVGVAIVVAASVGLVVMAASTMTDDAVAIGGRTVFCVAPPGEGPLPAALDDRCLAQRSDRRRQGLISATAAAMSSAAAACLVTAVGPLANRRKPGSREELVA